MTDIVEQLCDWIPEKEIEGKWVIDFDAIDAQREKAANEIKRLRASLHEEETATEALQAKLKSESSCACSYDNPDDICMCHSPKLVAAVNEIERLRKVLNFAAGYISTTSDRKTSHPEDVLKWLEHYALEEEQ
jgi:hypothetical protein